MAKLVGVLAGAALVIALIAPTRGLILVFCAAIITAVIVRRRRKASQRAAAAQELADYQHQFAEDRRRRELAFAQDLGRLLTLTADGFEHAVGAILAANGYAHVRKVGRSRDRGADILCDDSYGRRVVVQCKRYGPGNKVSSGEMQMLLGAVGLRRAHGLRGEVGIFVTSSNFTPEAEAIAEENEITLIDGPTLVAMAKQTSQAAPEPLSWPAPAPREMPVALRPSPSFPPDPPPVLTKLTIHGWSGEEWDGRSYEAY